MGTHIFYSANPAQATTPTTIMHPADMIAPATLYVVATPIGNLRDITLRALDVLAAVDVIAAEDTRTTRRLLTHFSISKRMIAVHQHNEMGAAQRVTDLLRGGQAVGFVTDAGTPGISDPGGMLVKLVREQGCNVVPSLGRTRQYVRYRPLVFPRPASYSTASCPPVPDLGDENWKSCGHPPTRWHFTKHRIEYSSPSPTSLTCLVRIATLR